MMPERSICVRGARTHNLKNLSVDLPTGQMTVITGLSGSGKSSLAYDTLFAEGQRRYLQSISAETQQQLRTMLQADVDEVSGLPPTVSVDQRAKLAPLRSTLAVTTEIHDYLRVLFARSGLIHCSECGRVVRSQTTDEIVAHILQLPAGSRFIVLAPLVRSRRGSHRSILDRIARNGLVRVRIDGNLHDVADVPRIDASREHTIEGVVDRLIMKDGVKSRLSESVALAVRESGDSCTVSVRIGDGWHDHFFNTRNSCPYCERSYPEPDPGLFSFNNARGACPACRGMGIRCAADESADITTFLEKPCATCGGSRLRPLSSAVTFRGITLPELCAQRVDTALETVARWRETVESGNTELLRSPDAACRVLPDLQHRLETLNRVGLSYITLDRPTRLLSGGEFQRARLATCLGSQLHGACYVLDEPTSALHPRDTHRLLQLLNELRNRGSTLIVVEHDFEVMAAADHLVALGPGAGADGGEMLYSGPPCLADASEAAAILVRPNNRPEDYVRHRAADDVSSQVRICGARQHNLSNVYVGIPLNRLVCVTGVSGSGKTTLIMKTLSPVAEAWFADSDRYRSACTDARCNAVDGLEFVHRVVCVDGRPLARNRRSCIATHSGVWNEIRRLFSHTREAQARGFRFGQFSFNSGSGRCLECLGTGEQESRMAILPDCVVRCSACRGTRFSGDILQIRFGGRNVSDVLELRVDEALDAFSEFDFVVRRLRSLHEVGLGYMTLGQPASSFSGGEAQRVRLAAELSNLQDNSALYLFDEPTRGLHDLDVRRLLNVLQQIVDRGNSVIVVEHNLYVMRSADWLIDMGPGAAEKGGRVVAAGTPESVMEVEESVTGLFLRQFRDETK